MSGANRSTSASHARASPPFANATRSAVDESFHMIVASSRVGGWKRRHALKARTAYFARAASLQAFRDFWFRYHCGPHWDYSDGNLCLLGRALINTTSGFPGGSVRRMTLSASGYQHRTATGSPAVPHSTYVTSSSGRSLGITG